jgi:hypothetical protein
MVRVLCITFVVSLTIPISAFAQSLSTKDIEDIRSSASILMETFSALLDLLSEEKVSSYDKKRLIAAAVSGKQRIFYKNEILITNDLDPEVMRWQVYNSKVNAEKYLSDFSLFMKKNREKAIVIHNMVFGEIYLDKGIFKGEIFFDFHYKVYHKMLGGNFQNTRKFAILIAEKEGGKWYSRIAEIDFFDPNKYARPSGYKVFVENVPVTTVSGYDAVGVTEPPMIPSANLKMDKKEKKPKKDKVKKPIEERVGLRIVAIVICLAFLAWLETL